MLWHTYFFELDCVCNKVVQSVENNCTLQNYPVLTPSYFPSPLRNAGHKITNCSVYRYTFTKVISSPMDVDFIFTTTLCCRHKKVVRRAHGSQCCVLSVSHFLSSPDGRVRHNVINPKETAAYDLLTLNLSSVCCWCILQWKRDFFNSRHESGNHHSNLFAYGPRIQTEHVTWHLFQRTVPTHVLMHAYLTHKTTRSHQCVNVPGSLFVFLLWLVFLLKQGKLKQTLRKHVVENPFS
jgi:hypothetical protein